MGFHHFWIYLEILAAKHLGLELRAPPAPRCSRLEEPRKKHQEQQQLSRGNSSHKTIKGMSFQRLGNCLQAQGSWEGQDGAAEEGILFLGVLSLPLLPQGWSCTEQPQALPAVKSPIQTPG